VALGTSPRSFPQSSSGRFEVIIVDRVSYRRITTSNRHSPERQGKPTCTAIHQLAAAVIGRSLDAVSVSWFVIPLDGRVLGIATHVLASLWRQFMFPYLHQKNEQI
jgi:hypothetical protein